MSRTTVTFVLNDRRDIAIAEATRERVKQAARELGYTPNPAARALNTGRANAITLALPTVVGSHFPRVIQAFGRVARAHGAHLLVTTTDDIDARDPLPLLRSVLAAPDDGIVLIDLTRALHAPLLEMLPLSKPIVTVPEIDAERLDCVEFDMGVGAEQAMEHLVRSGARRIAFFDAYALPDNGPPSRGDGKLHAYWRAMDRAGLPREIIIGSSEGTRRENMSLLRDYVAQHGLPDALLCRNDEFAIAAHRAVRAAGFRIPDDVRIVGGDGIEDTESLEPALSTITLPLEEMAEVIWQMLERRGERPEEPHQRVRLATELIVRGSSQPPIG